MAKGKRVKVDFSKEITWNEWSALSRKNRAQYYIEAEKGNPFAQRSLKKLYRTVWKTTNKSLRELRKHGYDYGKEYNHLLFYLQTEHRLNNAPSMTTIAKTFGKSNQYDYMDDVLEHAVKFLKTPTSDWKHMEETEKWVYENIRQKQISGTNQITKKERSSFSSYKEAKEFLRFLGNEEVSASLESVANSNDFVEALFDKYEVEGAKIFPIIEKALNEYNSAIIGFDDAMERAGIKVEDYFLGTRTT